MPSSKSDVKFNVAFNLEYLHFILIATQRRIILTPQRFERTFPSIQAVDGAGCYVFRLEFGNAACWPFFCARVC